MEVGLNKIGLAASIVAIMFSTSCATDLIGDSSDLGTMEYPVGMAIHPNGKYAYVVGSNFNLDYRATDGGAIYVLDLVSGQILPSSKRMGSFGTNIVLSSDARRGYTVTRDDDALVWFEISEDGSRIYCPNADDDSESLLKCRVIVDDDPTYVSVSRSYRESTQYDAQGNATTTRVDFDLLAIAQLRNARVTMVTAKDTPEGKVSFSHASASLLYSGSDAVCLGDERFVISGRAATSLLVVSPAMDEKASMKGVYASQAIAVPSGLGVYQGRGMVLSPSQKELFMLNQYPKSLMKFDVSALNSGEATGDKAAMTAMLMLPADMTRMVWIGDNDTGMIYVTSVVNDAMYVIDPRQMDILQTIDVGDGPYELAVHENDLYVVHFQGNDIWKYDVSDPTSPKFVTKILSQTQVGELE